MTPKTINEYPRIKSMWLTAILGILVATSCHAQGSSNPTKTPSVADTVNVPLPKGDRRMVLLYSPKAASMVGISSATLTSGKSITFTAMFGDSNNGKVPPIYPWPDASVAAVVSSRDIQTITKKLTPQALKKAKAQSTTP